MKRLFVFVLAMAMAFCLFACGGKNDDVREALQGTWSAKWTAMGKNINVHYTFKGDKCTAGGRNYYGEEHSFTEPYEITENKIIVVAFENGKTKELEYTYNKKTGELILWYSDEIQLEKGKVNVNYEWN